MITALAVIGGVVGLVVIVGGAAMIWAQKQKDDGKNPFQ